MEKSRPGKPEQPAVDQNAGVDEDGVACRAAAKTIGRPLGQARDRQHFRAFLQRDPEARVDGHPYDQPEHRPTPGVGEQADRGDPHERAEQTHHECPNRAREDLARRELRGLRLDHSEHLAQEAPEDAAAHIADRRAKSGASEAAPY